jgi:hypothetical protein
MEADAEGVGALYSKPWRKNYAKKLQMLPPLVHGGSAEESSDEKPPIPPHRVMDAATNTTIPRNEVLGAEYSGPGSRILRGSRGVKVCNCVAIAD